jgi:hypothetical protein
MQELKVTAPVEITDAFKLNGITYVPHYKNKNLYVGPGYPVGAGNPLPKFSFTARELIDAGAEKLELPLWPRPQLFEAAKAA